MSKNLYQILELSQDATYKQVKAAMIRLGKIYAPQAQTNENARADFNKIKEAYQVLSNPYQRAHYDDSLTENEEKNQNIKKYGRYFVKTWKKGWQVSKKWVIAGWQVRKKWVISGWQVSKRWLIERWQMSQRSFIENRVIREQQVIKKSENAKKLNAKKLSVTHKKLTKPPSTTKSSKATKLNKNILITDEKIIYQAKTHWFFYLDLGAVLLVILSSYFLAFAPAFIGEDMPTVLIWVPKLISRDLLEIAVWRLGLMALLFVGLMMLWEVFVIKQTTELGITSKRVLFKCGLLSRTIIELKLSRFESITIRQGPLGIIFNYGTITITGMGGVKTIVPNIVTPSRFKKILWNVVDKYENVAYW
ncbi:MAG: hypothetical protein DRQ49_10295 [Gammaproteobacteria bacterium]|nr:MAG: hypothetical protein DRQ49_10295 [Gammaproteobacteria bacterium]